MIAFRLGIGSMLLRFSRHSSHRFGEYNHLPHELPAFNLQSTQELSILKDIVLIHE